MKYSPRRAVAVAAITAGCVLLNAPVSLAAEHAAPQPKHARKPPHAIKLPADFPEWSKVADCESGGWDIQGPVYPDSLGITATNYIDFGGQPQPIGRATRVEIVEQIHVADRLIHAYHVGIPDQGYCADW